jgi:hypothetical protein
MLKTTKSLRLDPRAKQMVLGRLDLQKNQHISQLFCVEPAQLPFEGVMVVRGASRPIEPTQ